LSAADMLRISSPGATRSGLKRPSCRVGPRLENDAKLLELLPAAPASYKYEASAVTWSAFNWEAPTERQFLHVAGEPTC
jgi:hypothetical protein